MNHLRVCACALAALALAGCAAEASGTARQAPATGHLIGTLVMVGGPMLPGGRQPTARPIPGTVTITAAGHRRITVQVGPSGAFSLWLPPGGYQVSGRSPRVMTQADNGAERELPCSSPLPVTVTARHAAAISVACVVP